MNVLNLPLFFIKRLIRLLALSILLLFNMDSLQRSVNPSPSNWHQTRAVARTSNKNRGAPLCKERGRKKSQLIVKNVLFGWVAGWEFLFFFLFLEERKRESSICWLRWCRRVSTGFRRDFQVVTDRRRVDQTLSFSPWVLSGGLLWDEFILHFIPPSLKFSRPTKPPPATGALSFSKTHASHHRIR